VSYSTDGHGVYGYAAATSGTTYGIYGLNASTGGRGVYGEATATTNYTYGVYGVSHSSMGLGVYGEATAMWGNTYGIYGLCNSPSGRAVYGRSVALSGDSQGVFGDSWSNTGIGVYGRNISSSGYGVYSSGNFAASGTKSCVVKTSQGPTLMYCQESPENWFEDVGRGELIDGRAHVELDPLFLETVTINESHPMNVFVQLRGDCRGTFVRESFTGFDVIELQGGTSSVPFVYRVMAKRKGFEAKRLDYCAAAERDSYLFPELRDKERQELEAEQMREAAESQR
jgi:hypothetical protein